MLCINLPNCAVQTSHFSMTRGPFLDMLFYVCRVGILDQSFNNLEIDTIKLSVNEAKLAGLWATNCVTIQQVLISKSASGPEQLPGLSRNGPLAFEYRSEAGDDLKEHLLFVRKFRWKFSSNASGIFVGTETGTQLSFTIYKIPVNFSLSLDKKPGTSNPNKWYRKFRFFREKRKKGNSSKGITFFPENFHRDKPFHLNSPRNFRVFHANGKRSLFESQDFINCVLHATDHRFLAREWNYLHMKNRKVCNMTTPFHLKPRHWAHNDKMAWTHLFKG